MISELIVNLIKLIYLDKFLEANKKIKLLPTIIFWELTHLLEFQLNNTAVILDEMIGNFLKVLMNINMQKTTNFNFFKILRNFE